VNKREGNTLLSHICKHVLKEREQRTFHREKQTQTP